MKPLMVLDVSDLPDLARNALLTDDVSEDDFCAANSVYLVNGVYFVDNQDDRVASFWTLTDKLVYVWREVDDYEAFRVILRW